MLHAYAPCPRTMPHRGENYYGTDTSYLFLSRKQIFTISSILLPFHLAESLAVHGGDECAGYGGWWWWDL